MATTLLTEDGNKLTAEPIAGFSGVSTLNDTITNAITKETFDTDPTTRGWLLGTGWTYDSVNKRLNFT